MTAVHNLENHREGKARPNYELLNRKQHSLRITTWIHKNHSTNTSLSHLADKILTGFDSGLLTGMIPINLQKAFGYINHEILLKSVIYWIFKSINK